MRIREMRQRSHITQMELSRMLNVTQSTVAMWENGHTAPKSKLLPRLAEILCCSISDLFEEGK